MTAVALKTLDLPEEMQITLYYQETKRLYPGVPAKDDVLGRLAGLMLKLMLERLQRAQKQGLQG